MTGGGKPKLPYEIQMMLPKEIVHLIQSFVPPNEKLPSPKLPSPSLQKELMRIQSTHLKGKSAMYMKEFEDFVLD
jgi:hypothetical protein